MADDLVSALESSLQSCISLLLTNEGVDKGQHLADNFSGVESSITQFLEAAQALESDFLKRQMYVRMHHPQESVKQEIAHLKAELLHKEELLGKLSERADCWMKVLDELQRKQKEMEMAEGSIRKNIQVPQAAPKPPQGTPKPS